MPFVPPPPYYMAPPPVFSLPVRPNTTFDRPLDDENEHDAFTQNYAEHRAHVGQQETIIGSLTRAGEGDLTAQEPAPARRTRSLPSSPPCTPVQRPLSTVSAPAAAPGIEFPAPDDPAFVETPQVQNGPPSPTLAWSQGQFTMAQKVNPAEATVFVGNLPINRTDAELSKAMRQTFSKYGQVSVYIQRNLSNGINKPWALLQFTNKNDAHDAIREGNFIKYDGRTLRVDISQARRHITIRRWDGHIPSYWEVSTVFAQFGEIEHAYLSSWPLGVSLRFKCYGSYALAKEAVLSGTTGYFFV